MRKLSWIAIALLSAAAWAAPTSLVRVERQGPGDLATLRAAGVPVVAETLAGLIVEGEAADLARLSRMGFDYSILEADSSGRDYLVVPLRADRTLEQAAAWGTVLFVEDNLALLGIESGAGLPPDWELGCFDVEFLNRTPLELPAFAPPSRAESTDAAVPDPIVEQIVDAVDDAEMMATWTAVTDNPPTNTRFSTNVGCEDAADYCFNRYVGFGLTPEYDEWNSNHAPNVVAEIEGAVDPAEIYLLIGHLDDLPSSGNAPGADDNGSGTVTVLEGARVMSCHTFRNTVRYLNVTGEEQGLLGSDAYAAAAAARGDDIRGVLNFDMNGWEGDGTPVPEDLDVSYNSFSQWLGELYAENAATYQTGLVVDAFYCPSLTASDHASFWERGYPAIIGITDNHNYCGHGGVYPDYHESTDTIEACGDPTFFYATVRTAIATLAELAEPFVIAFDQRSYACDGVVEIVVGDAGANGDPGLVETLQVVVTSDSEPAGETLTLTERGSDSKIFSGTLALSGGAPVPGDGLLAVTEGDLLQTDYTDALDCAGNVNQVYSADAVVDCSGPLIDNVAETGITGSEATIVWSTQESADGSVVWGETTPPAQLEPGQQEALEHSVTLTGLQECTGYYYEVRAVDEAGNLSVADNGGQYFYFETLGDFGQGLQPCHAGQVTLDQAIVSCTGALTFDVTDLDLNTDPAVAETATLRLTSSTETTDELVVVTESGPNTSVFEGTIATTTGAPAADGQLQTADGDVVTVTYLDGDDGSGNAALAYATGSVDCAGPQVTDLRVVSITDARATVTFTTDEPGDTTVEWGPTAALGQNVSDPSLVTSHAAVVAGLDECAEAHLRVRTRDQFGHETVVDDLGSPHRFAAGTIPGLYWKDGFESGAPGWTLEGEWETGTPAGLGGSSGRADPTSAYNADAVLGHDLSGQGGFPGDYDPNTSETASTPELDAKTWTNTKLLLYKRLNVGAADDAAIWIFSPQGLPLYRSNGTTVTDLDYSPMSFDVGSLVDGRPSVRFEFRQQADGSSHYSGWNIDDVILKDGALPDYAQCGGCTDAPSFSGAVSAVDDDACADSGVTVSWRPAVAWGSGAEGSYAVYRDTVSDFTPSAGNRIASGVTGLSYTDATLAADSGAYYLVRAENAESCASGPANGGVTDANTAYRFATNWTSRPLPAELSGLTVDRVGGAHLRLAWNGDPDATSYRIRRSKSANGGFAQIGETAATQFDDLDAGADGESYYYLVVGANACGTAGP